MSTRESAGTARLNEPVLAVAWVRWMVVRAHGGAGPMITLDARWSRLVIAVVVVFGVLRNLPIGSWLAGLL